MFLSHDINNSKHGKLKSYLQDRKKNQLRGEHE